MNGLLWLGVISTVVLVAAVALDGVVDAIDALEIGPGWLSLPVLAAFFGAFGFVAGAPIDVLGPAALVVGAASGAAFGYGAVRLSTALMNMPTDATDSDSDLLASFGRIVTPTAPGRFGEVLLDRPAGPVKVSCIADVELAAGVEIVVVDVSSSTLVTVAAFDDHGIGQLRGAP